MNEYHLFKDDKHLGRCLFDFEPEIGWEILFCGANYIIFNKGIYWTQESFDGIPKFVRTLILAFRSSN